MERPTLAQLRAANPTFFKNAEFHVSMARGGKEKYGIRLNKDKTGYELHVKNPSAGNSLIAAQVAVYPINSTLGFGVCRHEEVTNG